MEIYERIKKRRKELGLSADDIAAVLGISRATVYRYESRFIEKMPLTILDPLANALHCSPSYLMGWDDAPPAALLSSEEEHVIGAYRKASEDTKAAVCAVLGVKREPTTPSEALPESSDKAAG